MKFISPKVHGFLYLAVILALFVSPSLFAFSQNASSVTYILAAAYVLIVLFTAYPLGLFKAIPFTVHGALELILSPLLIAMPWLAAFRMDAGARYFYIVAGVLLFITWLFTDYKAADIVYRKKGIDVGGDGKMRGAHA